MLDLLIFIVELIIIMVGVLISYNIFIKKISDKNNNPNKKDEEVDADQGFGDPDFLDPLSQL